MQLKGKIFSGMGVGKEYLSLEPYKRKIEEITGFRPFPGTLNLRCEKSSVEETLEKSEASRIDSFEFEGEKYSGVNVYEAELKDLSVAILRMDVTDYGPEVVEIVAEENLREKFDLEDGEEISLVF